MVLIHQRETCILLIFPSKKPLEFLGNGGDCWGKNCPPLFAIVCGGNTRFALLNSFQGSKVDFDDAKAKCASFSMTLATFDDAAEVDKIYEVIGESELIFENEFVIFLRDSPVQAATKCGRRPTTSTAAVSSQEFVRQINLAGSNFFESNLLFSFSTFCFYYGLPFKPFRTM